MSAPSEAAGLLEHLVFEIAEGVSAQTGEAFFHSLVRRLAAVLKADFVLLGALQPGGKQIATLAAYGVGADAPVWEYDKNLLLAQMGAAGYVDCPMIDSGGRHLGLVCALTRQPLQHPKLAEALVRIFAVRAASELERQNYEKELARREQRVAELTEPTPSLASQSLHDAERRHVEGVLASTRWVVEGPKGAAGILKMNPSTLRSLMKRLGIRRPA